MYTTSDSPQLLLITYDDPNPTNAIKKDDPYHGRVKIGYCSRKHDGNVCYKNTWSYLSKSSDKEKKIYTIMGFTGMIHI